MKQAEVNGKPIWKVQGARLRLVSNEERVIQLSVATCEGKCINCNPIEAREKEGKVGIELNMKST